MIKTAKEAYEYAYNYGLTFPKDWQISKNFTWNEVFVNELKTDGIPYIDVFENAVELSKFLQKIREHICKPINVHCWVRQIPHNKRAGSTAKYSPHIKGRAVDFDVYGLTDDVVRTIILKMNLPVRIEAKTVGWVHIDINNSNKPFKYGLFNP